MSQNKWQFCTERADGEIQADWYAAIMLGDEEGEVVFHYVCVEKGLTLITKRSLC